MPFFRRAEQRQEQQYWSGVKAHLRPTERPIDYTQIHVENPRGLRGVALLTNERIVFAYLMPDRSTSFLADIELMEIRRAKWDRPAMTIVLLLRPDRSGRADDEIDLRVAWPEPIAWRFYTSLVSQIAALP